MRCGGELYHLRLSRSQWSWPPRPVDWQLSGWWVLSSTDGANMSPTKGSQTSASCYKCTSWDFIISLQLWIAVSDERCYWWKNASAETVFRGLRTTDRDDRWSPKVDEITQEERIEWERKGEDWTWQNNGERRGTWWESQEYVKNVKCVPRWSQWNRRESSVAATVSFRAYQIGLW